MVTRCIMAYPCFQSLVMPGNMFKHNWNGFCQREKQINLHKVYEHTYFSTFIMIPLFLMLMTTGHIQNMCCVSMNNIQTTFLESISFHVLTTIDQHESKQSLQNGTSIFEEEFKFQYVRGDFDIFNKVALCQAI